MRRPTGIILDTLDRMPARSIAVEIYDPDSAFCAPAAVADGDAAGVVAPAEVLAFAGEGEGEVGAAAVEVVVYGAFEMADAWGAGLVGAQGERGFRGVFGADVGVVWVGLGGVHVGVRGGEGGGVKVVDCLGVGAEGGVGEEGAGKAVVYSGLEHGGDGVEAVVFVGGWGGEGY